jgi:hypothetical protein
MLSQNLTVLRINARTLNGSPTKQAPFLSTASSRMHEIIIGTFNIDEIENVITAQ